MDEKDLISKKELLQLTGISYGQLYRWKRENLIPEAWFIKQSSFTGQETFFPRDKILKRIEMIQELKDKYSLEELARMLSPELTSRTFKSTEIKKLDEIDAEILDIFKKTFGKDFFTFIELLFIYLLSGLKGEIVKVKGSLTDITIGIRDWMSGVNNTSYRFIVCRRGAEVFTLLVDQDAQLLMDEKTNELKVVYLEELSKDFNLKYKDVLGGV